MSNVPLDDNIYTVGHLKFVALGDRVLIQEDQFRSGYECETCEGTGTLVCSNCTGAGSRNAKKCSFCDGVGKIRCEACNGRGGLLAVPEVAQRRPTTGLIVSVGDAVRNLRRGESVMYSNFAGFVVNLDRAGLPVVLRILHESEILCGISGQMTLTNVRHKTEIAGL